ncbi:MAG: thiamine-phosphate kinase [Gammaproteobacteria bacterium]
MPVLPSSEFDLIEQYFCGGNTRKDVLLGIGDDAALLTVPAGKALAVSVDTLVAGVHFFDDAPPASIGHKALAVNLSDMAAMGAEPAWFTLAITLPENDDAWLRPFCTGMFSLAEQYNITLVGGDTTRGPLCLSIQMSGFCTKPLRRDKAKPGQLIMVSGTLGDAAAAVAAIKKNQQPDDTMRQKLLYPEPQIKLGLALVNYADAAIDISDGLVADLGHILEASQCGATLYRHQLPLSSELLALHSPEQWHYALAGGDDYQLCFTLDPEHAPALKSVASTLGVQLTVIGVIDGEPGLRVLDEDGCELSQTSGGYDHFG